MFTLNRSRLLGFAAAGAFVALLLVSPHEPKTLLRT